MTRKTEIEQIRAAIRAADQEKNMNDMLLKTTYDAIDTVENGLASREEVLNALNFMDALSEATRELKARLEAAAIKWIEANGELEFGDIRYYVGPNKTTKCLNLSGTLEALLTATGGDFEAVVRCLSTSAFKHGACREALPESEYNALFKTEEVMDLKEGKPKGPRLQKVNERFLK